MKLSNGNKTSYCVYIPCLKVNSIFLKINSKSRKRIPMPIIGRVTLYRDYPGLRAEFTIDVQICGSADRGSKRSAVPIRGSQQYGFTNILPDELQSSDRRS